MAVFPKKRISWQYVIAGVISFGGIALGVRAFVGHRVASHSGRIAAIPAVPQIDPEVKDADFYDVRPTAATIEHASALVAQAALQAMIAMRWKGEAAPEYPESMSEQIQQATTMYLRGSIGSYEEYTTSHGLQLPPNWELNKKRFREGIELSFQTLKLARLNTRRVVVRPRFVQGKEVAYEDDSQTSVKTAYRPERMPRSHTADRELLDVYEVIVPAETVVYDVPDGSNSLGNKESTRARFGMWFKMDRSSQKWVLMKIVIYDNPRSTAVVMPPL